MLKKDRNHQMHVKEAWENKSKEGPSINLKYARDLPDDTPQFILKRFAELQIDVTKFCFDGYSGGLIADVGCGVGDILMRAIGASPETSTNYVGLDISKSILKKAATRAKGSNSNASFFQGSITDLPFKDNNFNLIICVGNVITYLASLDEVSEAINEFHRVLNPDGILVVDFTNRFSYTSIAVQILHRHSPEPHKNISPFWFIKELKKTGFSILTYHGFDFKPVQGRIFQTKWKHLDSEFIEKFSNLIEKKLVPHLPVISLFAGRVYIKCRKKSSMD